MRFAKDRSLELSGRANRAFAPRRFAAAVLALTIATIAAAGSASAVEPKPQDDRSQQQSDPQDPNFQQPDEFLTIDINLLGCSFGAGLGADLLLAMGAGGGSSTNVNSGLVTRLKMAGCLPWE